MVLHVLPYCVSFEDTHGHSHAHKEKGEKVLKEEEEKSYKKGAVSEYQNSSPEMTFLPKCQDYYG